MPNGSFEEYNWCPNSIDGFYIDACKYWTMPTLGSSDYFNSCSTDTGSNTFPQFGVPQNYAGHQYARTGDGYSGLVFSQTEENTPPYSEYIQVKLKSQLETGKHYHLQFFINNSYLSHNSQPMCYNSIGALFAPNELNINNYDLLPMEPQFQSDLNQFFCDTAQWFELNHTFQATGNENYLIIGVFTPLPIIQMTDYDGNTLIDEVTPYYYIDDVSLIEVDYMSLIEGKIPNVFTPNGDGINDYFMFDNALVQAKNLTILNRWGNIIFQSNSSFLWDGTYNGKECKNGVYYYIIEVGNDIKLNGFLTLMR